MSESTSIILTDYQQLYQEARLRFLSSSDWEKKRNSFLRELHQKVVIGDNEELKRILRLKKHEELETFNKSWVSKIWEKSYDATKNEFNIVNFFRKLAMVNDGQIDIDELRAFFIYKCITENIDNLLCQVLDYEARNRSIINAHNIVINNGEIVIQREASREGDENPFTEHLDNIIFQTRFFESDVSLTTVRNAIASFINLGEDNDKLSPAAADQIDPTELNEWYYILVAITEAEVISRTSITDITFVEQMICWFPWLFHFDSVNDMMSFKRKFARSLSAERSKWRYGKKKYVTSIKDMWSRQHTLKIEYTKLSRLYSVANGLKTTLERIKTDILKNQNSKSSSSQRKSTELNKEIIIDELCESTLASTNNIVVTEVDGKSISLYRLYKHVEKIFGGQYQNKYEWVAVWQWMKNNGLLKKGYRTYEAFALQWGQKEWSVNGADLCDKKTMRYYAVVDGVPVEDWDSIEGKKRTTQDGFLGLKKIYTMLDNNFQMSKILK